MNLPFTKGIQKDTEEAWVIHPLHLTFEVLFFLYEGFMILLFLLPEIWLF